MTTYLVHREGQNSWMEHDVTIEAETLAEAKRKASAMNEFGMNTVLLDAERRPICFRRFFERNNGTTGHRPWRPCQSF